MGGNICKTCNNYMGLEDENLSRNNIDKSIDNYNNKSNNNQNSNRTYYSNYINNPISPLIDNGTIINNSNNKNKSFLNKTASKNEDLSQNSQILVDESEINKIIFSYKIKLLISSFRKFKKMKDEAHKIISLRKNLKEKRNLISIEGNENFNVDLFPSQKYNFLGNIFEEKEDGFGIQYFPENQAKYVGHFINGKRINLCYFEDKSQSYTYKGDSKNNFTGLYGIYYNYDKGITYEGEWLNNRKDGIGIEIYKDGSKYMGEHKNGVKQGLGTYFWSDGSKYEGEWKYNLMDGYGIYKFKDGSICSGFWSSNQMNGFGKFLFPQVKCYIGFFKKDHKNGFGILFWLKEEKAFIGYWKDNKQDGLGKFIFEGKIRYGSWKLGNREKKLEENDFFNLLNEQNSSNFILHIFKSDYNGLHDYIQNYNDF